MTSISSKQLVVQASLSIINRNRHGWGRVKCPLCIYVKGTEDPHRALGVHISGKYNCFRCRSKGFVRFDGSERYEPGLLDTDADADKDYGPPENFIQLTVQELDAISLREPIAYLLSRGVSIQTMLDAKVGVCLRGEYAGRIVVPVFDETGRYWRGWSARLWRDSNRSYPPKYLTCEDMDRANLVWNSAALFVETDVPVMVVEGTFDGLPYFPDVVALLGKPSQGQEELLARAKRPIVVVLDGDAWFEGEMLAFRLELDGAQARSIKLPAKTDPGSFDHAELKSLIEIGQSCE
jgi:hypothetical protein